MAGIDILVAGAHSLAPHLYRDLVLHFVSWSGGPLPKGLRGRIWAIIPALTHSGFGFALCAFLRSNPATSDAYISLWANCDIPDITSRAARYGANDVITGDLGQANLEHHLARILDRERLGFDRFLRLRDYAVDLNAYRARWQGKPVALGSSELLLFAFLLSHPDTVHTVDDLIAAVGSKTDLSQKSVQRRISRLRKQLEAAGAVDPIRVVRGSGYVVDS